MVQVLIPKKTKKDLAKQNRTNRLRILSGLLSLENKTLTGINLYGKYNDFYSLKIWPFRIIYKINKHNIIILKIIDK
jgi:mRNA-degrading endonuclease RelE of RelBE toxin-antitoxin system